jgi:hypothetical protein
LGNAGRIEGCGVFLSVVDMLLRAVADGMMSNITISIEIIFNDFIVFFSRIETNNMICFYI